MRVVFSRGARDDLIGILRFIKADSPIAAHRYVEALHTKAMGLRRFPKRYAVRDDLPGELRAAPHRSHLIIFKILADRVEIVRIVHGAMDLNRIFGGNA